MYTRGPHTRWLAGEPACAASGPLKVENRLSVRSCSGFVLLCVVNRACSVWKRCI